MLHSYWTVRNEAIEHIPVDNSCVSLVVADAAQPLARRKSSVGAAEQPPERRWIDHAGGPDGRSSVCGRERRKVDVVIVETGYNGAARCVQFVCCRSDRADLGDRGDNSRRERNVAVHATEIGSANDQLWCGTGGLDPR